MAAPQGSGAPPGPMMPQGPPYAPPTAMLGGLPTVAVDVPICAVLLPFYIGFAAFNMTTFQRNRRRGHKFIPSAAVFGFCMARTVALVMRIVWATRPHNVRVAIAANVFTNAGVLVLFVVNIIFAQRIVRAYHPRFGWSEPFRWLFRCVYFSVFAVLVLIITAIVYGSYTLDPDVQNRLRIIRLVAITYIAVLPFMPLPLTLLSMLIPHSAPLDKFGEGRMRTKVGVVLLTSFLLTLGAGFRCGVSYVTRPISDPGWFNHRACLYVFVFAIEITVLFMLAFAQIDHRFHIPDGSSGPGHYSRGVPDKDAEMAGKAAPVFGDGKPKTAEEEAERETAWELRLRQEMDNETL